MKSTHFQVAVRVVCLFLLLAPAAWAQVPASANQTTVSAAPSSADVPRLIKFSGTLLEEQGQALKGPVGVTFALYSQQSGGAALWLETQNVKPDANGNYTVLLGANSANGVPTELFVSGEARWLGIQVGQQPEHERILLVSVPYALKAGDAETLGGKPLSSFVLNEASATASSAGSAAAATSAPGKMQTTTGAGAKTSATPQAVTPCTSLTSDGTATTNSIALFTTACNVQSSLMTQVPINGFPGVNVSGNNAGLLLNGTGTHQVTVTGATSGRLGQDANGFFFASDTNGKSVRFLTNNGTLNEWLRITSAGNVGIGTAAPVAPLEVVGSGLANHSRLTNTNAASVGPALYFKAANKDWTIYATNPGASAGDQKLIFRDFSSATDRIAIDASGNVGIGTTTPGTKLDVAGTGNFTGGLMASSFAGSGASLIGSNASPIVTVSQGGSGDTFHAFASASGAIAVRGDSSNTNGTALLGSVEGINAVAVYGSASSSATGSFGVLGIANNATGVAGVFDNTSGGKILSARVNGVEKLSVDGSGAINFSDGTKQTTSAGAVHTVIVVGSVSITPSNFNEVILNCPANFHALSGGMDSGDVLLVEQTASSPIIGGNHIRDLADGTYSAATGWLVAAHNTDTVNTFIMKAAVICAPD